MTREVREQLISIGWVETMANCCYEKGHYELVFDTSSYVEIYDKTNSRRLVEGSIADLDELLLELNSIRK